MRSALAFCVGCLLVPGVAVAQLPAVQPIFNQVQPIFNQQLGAGVGQNQGNAGARPGRPGLPPGQVVLPGRLGWDLAWHRRNRLLWPGVSPWYGWNSGFFPAYGYSWSYAAPLIVQPQPIVVQVPVVVPVAVPMGQQPMVQQPGRPAVALPAPRRIAPPDNVDAGEQEILRRVAALKPSTEDGRMRADQAIADGDREFAEGRHRRAITRYRDAIRRAPDYTSAYFRAGHAHVAVGDYDLALTYFAMALEIARTPHRDGFSLDTLYRDDQQSKQEHLAALGGAIRQQPNDGGLQFLLGITLHYDGNPLKAREYFRKSLELPGRHRPYANLFLPNPPPPPPLLAPAD